MANKENMQKWIDALLSDRFKQGSGKLKAKSEGVVRHCCLGVTCEVAMENGVALEIGVHSELYMGADAAFYTFEGQSGFLPAKVQHWLGIDTTNPTVGYADQEGHPLRATFANDECHYSFKEIANGLKEVYTKE